MAWGTLDETTHEWELESEEPTLDPPHADRLMIASKGAWRLPLVSQNGMVPTIILMWIRGWVVSIVRHGKTTIKI